jgi:hypothetical protein
MPSSAGSASQEYWRPASPSAARAAQPFPAPSTCPDCGVEYAFGARFCYVCGSERGPRVIPRRQPLTFTDIFDLTVIRDRLELSPASLLFLLAGMVCLFAAIGVGFIYKTETLAEWQAVQWWRTEWLLGTAATLLAGMLLKKSS